MHPMVHHIFVELVLNIHNKLFFLDATQQFIFREVMDWEVIKGKHFGLMLNSYFIYEVFNQIVDIFAGLNAAFDLRVD